MGLYSPGRKYDPETVLKRKDGLLFNQIDGEIVLLSVENSQYFGMDKTGSRIWELIEKPITLMQLVSILLKYYDVSEEKCMKDTIAFLKNLEEKNLLIFD